MKFFNLCAVVLLCQVSSSLAQTCKTDIKALKNALDTIEKSMSLSTADVNKKTKEYTDLVFSLAKKSTNLSKDLPDITAAQTNGGKIAQQTSEINGGIIRTNDQLLRMATFFERVGNEGKCSRACDSFDKLSKVAISAASGIKTCHDIYQKGTRKELKKSLGIIRDIDINTIGCIVFITDVELQLIANLLATRFEVCKRDSLAAALSLFNQLQSEVKASCNFC